MPVTATSTCPCGASRSRTDSDTSSAGSHILSTVSIGISSILICRNISGSFSSMNCRRLSALIISGALSDTK